MGYRFAVNVIIDDDGAVTVVLMEHELAMQKIWELESLALTEPVLGHLVKREIEARANPVATLKEAAILGRAMTSGDDGWLYLAEYDGHRLTALCEKGYLDWRDAPALVRNLSGKKWLKYHITERGKQALLAYRAVHKGG